jgi:hypothetical protein
MKKIFVYPTFLIVFISLACQFTEQSTPTIDVTEIPPLTQEIGTQPLVNTDNPLSGLVYSFYDEGNNNNEIWQIDGDSKARKLLPNHYLGVLNSNGNQLVYYDNFWNNNNPCTWLADFKTNKIQSLDCATGAGIQADILGWLPNQPTMLIAVLDLSLPGMEASWGKLGTISLENGDKEILDPEHQVQTAEISPNGKMIVYGDNELSGWLYSFDSGVKAFLPQDYGINYSKVGSPAWSPDGTKIAWGLMDDEFNSAIGIFDLDKKTAVVLHAFKQEIQPDYRPLPPSPIWSSDGNWLVVETIGNSSWILSKDGKTEYEVSGFNSWSPDGRWIVYLAADNELVVSSLDGSDATKLGQVNYAYDGGSSVWSNDAQFLAFIGADKKIRLVKTGEWKVNEVTNVETASFLLGWNPLIPSFYETAEIPPTATSEPDFSCPNAPRTRLRIGDKARTTFTDGSTTRLRSAPEAGNNGIDNLPEGTEFEIVGGPVCYPRPDRNDAYVYWEILVPSRNNIKGWVAEGDLNSYYIEPLK